MKNIFALSSRSRFLVKLFCYIACWNAKLCISYYKCVSWFAAVPATKKLFFDRVNIRLNAQLINGISNVLQRILRYFNGTIISTSFVPFFSVFLVTCCLNLNKILLLLWAGKSIITSLKLFHLYSIAINFLMFPNKYHYIPLFHLCN